MAAGVRRRLAENFHSFRGTRPNVAVAAIEPCSVATWLTSQIAADGGVCFGSGLSRRRRGGRITALRLSGTPKSISKELRATARPRRVGRQSDAVPSLRGRRRHRLPSFGTVFADPWLGARRRRRYGVDCLTAKVCLRSAQRPSMERDRALPRLQVYLQAGSESQLLAALTSIFAAGAGERPAVGGRPTADPSAIALQSRQRDHRQRDVRR